MAALASQRLPVDIFHMLALELSARADFPTLFNYAVSSKLLANAGAVSALYRISHQAPVTGGGESLSFAEHAEQGLIILKWSILWRSIILSTFGQTLFPYCRYLRRLDLHNLAELLEDDRFRAKVQRNFFDGALSQFHHIFEFTTTMFTHGDDPKKYPVRHHKRLDVPKIISEIGSKLTSEANLLEELTEPIRHNILSVSLPLWTPQLRHLRYLSLWDGKIFANQATRELLHVHCPDLTDLRIYCTSNEDGDHTLALFIGGMQENSLTNFENLSDNCRIGVETCLALNRHGKSLQNLKLFLTGAEVLALARLQDCVSLQSLSVKLTLSSMDLKATQNDIFLEIIHWLTRCKTLKDISFHDVMSAPDLLEPVLLDKDINLQRLQINAKERAMYVIKDHHSFHQALTQQRNLCSLFLCADADENYHHDTQIVIDSICSLQDLRELRLTRISDNYNDENLIKIAQSLQLLEDLYIGGYGTSDAVLQSFAELKNLKVMSFSGLTRFTVDGILNFINRLGEGNSGINLSIDNADPDCGISPEGQEMIKEVLQKKLNGRFEYQFWRDPDQTDFDGSEDSD